MIDAREAVGPLINQMRSASFANLYFIALMAALAIPDMLAGLGADDGRTSGPKYRTWIEVNLGQSGNDASMLYGLRCSILHQGSAHPHGGHARMAFIEPGGHGSLHNLSTQVGDETVGWLDVPTFVEEIALAAEAWLTRYGDTQLVQRNLQRFARRRPEGLPPHVAGAPVIA